MLSRHSFWIISTNIIVIISLLTIYPCSSQLDYDIKRSYSFNVYSAITHCNQKQIKNWQCKICNKVETPQSISYIYNRNSNILAYMGYLPNLSSIFIAFRGTQDIKNWIEDFSYKQIDYPRCKNCKIHAGFYTSYLSIELSILNQLRKLKEIYKNPNIIVLGSSLGGALSTVAALQLQLIEGNVYQLHNFGGPRVGNLNYAEFLRQKINRIFRVVHNADIVPHLPLVAQNYHHPPYQILFDEAMEQYRICDVSGEDQTCSDSFAPDYSISDHLLYWQKPILQDVCTISEII